jgi:hypothetical protein
MEDDWELLHSSDDDSDILTSNHSIIKGINANDFNNSIIRSDYFSIHSHNHNPNFVAEESSVESDNPSWIDPESVIPYPSPQLWSDSSSDVSSDHHHVAGSEIEDLRSDDSKGELESLEGKEGGNGVIEAKSERSGVWWNLPLELLKYCVFRASPVWSVSVAAAVLGLVILGRRLYKMKKKTRSLPLKLTLDDKKVSQFMNRAARLNEAFSVVKRVPIIRPSLPAPGVTSWPIMSLR